MKRLKLDDPSWAGTILDYANKIVTLNDRSKEYDIKSAVKNLEDLYLKKVEDYAESICNNGGL